MAVNKDLAEGLLEKEREPKASKVDTCRPEKGPCVDELVGPLLLLLESGLMKGCMILFSTQKK